MAGKKWSNVEGRFYVEMYTSEGKTLDASTDLPLPDFLNKYVVDDNVYELIIEFTSSGYYDPGSMYGGSDRLGWPPEGEDERIMTDCYLEVDSKPASIPFTDEQKKELFDFFCSKIQEVELDFDEF